MDIRNVLNNPGDEPRRRPRPSFSTQNSQSPAADYQRQSSVQSSTPISPPALNSLHESVNQGYFDRQPSAFPSTPSSPQIRNPRGATPQSLNLQAPIETPSPSTQLHGNVTQPSPRRASTQRTRGESLSVSPKTVVTKLPSHPLPTMFEKATESEPQQKQETMTNRDQSTDSAVPMTQVSVDDVEQLRTPETGHAGKTKRRLIENAETPRRSPEEHLRVKRRRLMVIPIWARPAKKLKPLAKYNTNGANTSNAKVEVKPDTQPEFGYDGPLGPFEDSFRGSFIPHEELTKQICDFLFQHVIMNDSIGTSRVGEAAKVEGQLEIEAKIGTIIDKKVGERLELPVTSETILRQDFDVAFESMMTEQQHRSFNDLLNEALKASHGPPVAAHRSKPPKPRIPMSYEHRYEVDTFYELPDDEVSNLPQTLQPLLKSHRSRRPTVRVTRHKKTGEILAKIVKARISDLHISSPSTRFDWRVSVNLEANWDGNLEALIQASGGGVTNGHSAHPDRHKDRMSYTHLFCQIDLTQVKTLDTKDMPNATHELEVELDSSAVREQGQLVMRGMDNQYQELVKAFVDNVRILVRGVQ